MWLRLKPTQRLHCLTCCVCVVRSVGLVRTRDKYVPYEDGSPFLWGYWFKSGLKDHSGYFLYFCYCQQISCLDPNQQLTDVLTSIVCVSLSKKYKSEYNVIIMHLITVVITTCSEYFWVLDVLWTFFVIGICIYRLINEVGVYRCLCLIDSSWQATVKTK